MTTQIAVHRTATFIYRETAARAFKELLPCFQGDWNAIDEFSLAHLVKIARADLSSDPTNAHQVLAMAAAVHWDEAGVDRHFNAALGSDESEAIRSNYAFALDCIGRCDRAANMYERSAHINFNDVTVLQKAIETQWRAGRWARSIGLTKILRLSSPPANPEPSDAKKKIVECTARIGASPYLLERLHAAIHSFLRDRKIRSVSSSFDLDDAAGNDKIHLTMDVLADPETVECLNEELAVVSSDAMESHPLSHFCIGLSGAHAMADS